MAPSIFKLIDYADHTISSSKPIAILFRSDNEKDDDYAMEFQDAAYEFHGKKPLYFAYTNMNDEWEAKIATYMDITRGLLP